MTDQMLELYTRDYLQPLYYFCLRKTGSAEEAEELSADISLQIVTQLRRGILPAQFSAWVWQIARNRYGRWVKGRVQHRERIAGEPEDTLTDDTPSPEEAVIADESMQLLRRELAFIRGDYRDLIVAYYFTQTPLRKIAATLGIPEGTAKTRLFSARKHLLEGMEMAREFGKRSYNPETVDFSSCGNQPSGLPWRAVGRALPNNILLEASGNPSTAEELAIELGIALPYMEEEIKLLTEATLLTCINGKYVTNFPIIDKETHTKVRVLQLESGTERANAMAQALRTVEPELIALGLYRDDISLNEQRWTWAMYLFDELLHRCDRENGVKGFTPRSDGGKWDFIGWEETDLPHMGSGHNGCGDGRDMIWAYSGRAIGLEEQGNRIPCDMDYSLLLGDILRRERRADSLSAMERELILRYGYAAIEGNAVVPRIAIIDNAAQNALENMMADSPAFGRVYDSVNTCFAQTLELLTAAADAHLRDQLPRAVSFLQHEMRTILMLALRDLGYLSSLPRDTTAMIYFRMK